VEEAVRLLPAVEDAAVCAFEQSNGDVRIVAYVVLDRGVSTSASALRRALRARLPDHMVPSALVVLDGLPLTPMGKVDQQKLRQMRPSDSGSGRTDPPQSPTEQALAEIWTEELDLPSVGRNDDFFSLGGDSLLAAVAQARIQEAFGIELDLSMFADHSTLAAMASVIEDVRCAAVTEAGLPLVRVPRSEPLPLSSFQERVWSYSQTPDGSAGYCRTDVRRVVGALDSKLLADCLIEIANRHEILRTTYSIANGSPVQIVHPLAHAPVTFDDLSHLPNAEQRAWALLNQLAAETLDLEKGPMLRFSIVRLREHEHWLLRSSHYIAGDGWSWKMFRRELAQLYTAKLRGEPPPLSECERLQYADYAVWQRNRLGRERPGFQKTIAYWKDVLCNPQPPLQLPFRRPVRLDGADPDEGVIEVKLDPRVSRRLAQLTRAEGTTYYVTRLAAFVALLAFATGQSDVTFGTYVANRYRRDLQGIFGFFANLITLRFRFEPAMSFRQWLPVVHRAVWRAVACSEIPYEDLCHELQQQGVRPPGIELIFASEGISGSAGDADGDDSFVDFAGLSMSRLTSRRSRMPWGFSFSVKEQSSRCIATFDAAIYDPVGVRNFTTSYFRLLDAASRHPDSPMSALLNMTDHGFDNRVQRELQEPKDRVAKLAARIESIGRAFSRARHQKRRSWLRLPRGDG
jgi:hypothetical protein